MFILFLDDETMKFIREHSFMSKSVQALASRPIFTLTGTRFTYLALEVLESKIENENGTSIALIYVGKYHPFSLYQLSSLLCQRNAMTEQFF